MISVMLASVSVSSPEPRSASPIYSSPVDCRGRPEDGYYIDARSGRKEHIYESLSQDSESECPKKVRQSSNRGVEKKPPLPGSSTLNLRRPLSERSNRPLSNIFSSNKRDSDVDVDVTPDLRHTRRTVYFADHNFDDDPTMTSSTAGPRSSSCERETPRKSRKDMFLFWKSSSSSSSSSKNKTSSPSSSLSSLSMSKDKSKKIFQN